MNQSDRYVAIMAGGIGSRFWPVSRTAHPKQFLDILGNGSSLLQQAFHRYSLIVPVENIFIITAAEYVNKVQEQLPLVKPENILAEPSRKNTAACNAYVGFKLLKENPDALLLSAPADNYITDIAAFAETVNKAFDFVENVNALVTIGIKPTYPNTGYGYIQHDSPIVSEGVYKVKTFTEKPNYDLARTFIESGDFLWNAGIFTWKVKNFIKAFEQLMPEMFDAFNSEYDNFNTPLENEAINRIYPQCTNISIDFGIMEKAQNVYVIPATFSWSDLGTWHSAWENKEKDYFMNAVNGNKVMVVDANNCMINVPNDKLVVLQGLKDYIIVDTNDVLLICKKDKEQEIKEYVAEVKRNWGDKHL